MRRPHERKRGIKYRYYLSSPLLHGQPSVPGPCSKLKDEDFNTERSKPGTSGEVKLRNELMDELFG
jgi:hypothetical protein